MKRHTSCIRTLTALLLFSLFLSGTTACFAGCRTAGSDQTDSSAGTMAGASTEAPTASGTETATLPADRESQSETTAGAETEGGPGEVKEEPVPGVAYGKLDAPDEDASVQLWFDHLTEKVYQDCTVTSGRNTYVMSMAGNSIEACQFFLAPQSDRAFDVTLTNFIDTAGHTMLTSLLREHYVCVADRMIPDALPPVDGPVPVKAEQSQGFVVKVKANANQPSGLYTAVLTVRDAETGKIIKTANVYANVWDFSLSEETALKTAINVNSGKLQKAYADAGMTELSSTELYRIYYDFMLENRMAGYVLPYKLNDDRVLDYLNNPRVTSFVINFVHNGNEAGAYEMLKGHPDWLRKGYFYLVDEPTNLDLLGKLTQNGERLAQNFPGYRQVSPFFTNISVDANRDQIEVMKDCVNIWCTKIFTFTPRSRSGVEGTQFLMTRPQERKFGTFTERMHQLRERGDELWLYFCWEPAQPYTNWLVLGDGIEPVVSIWQCALTEATGVLYWYANYWTKDPYNDLTPRGGATAHGDGVLIYPGSTFGLYEPVSSLRLEAIRAGIQDYQLLSMLERGKGKGASDAYIALVTTDVVTYTRDDTYLHAVRVMLGEAVSAMLKADIHREPST